ncbi:unnamed protein product [Gongylonema pulchrum]|uniref:RRM domain-containing protein n=1 Tax=Gongylonema pulchrum TaxID=637853 RepID=A0A183EQP2_9BILA|nr:unnamed protein product [Gongylonema pulchrum]
MREKAHFSQLLKVMLLNLDKLQVEVFQSETGRFTAYVNFDRLGPAQTIRQTMLNRLKMKLGPRLWVHSPGDITDQSGMHSPDLYTSEEQADAMQLEREKQ